MATLYLLDIYAGINCENLFSIDNFHFKNINLYVNQARLWIDDLLI